MGCQGCSHRIKDSSNVYEYKENLAYNIEELKNEKVQLTPISKELFELAKRIIKVNESLLEVMNKLKTYELMTHSWEELRDHSDVCFSYYYSCYAVIHPSSLLEEDENSKNFLLAEKVLNDKRKELSNLIKT